VHEDTKKFYFTLMDFRGATDHFAAAKVATNIPLSTGPQFCKLAASPAG